MEKGINNLLGLVMDDEDYEHPYRAKFHTPTKPAVYDETIPNNATNVAQSKAKDFHTAKIAVYPLFAAAERKTRDFILAVVVDTWVRKLRETITFYTAMSPLDLLNRLQTLFGGLHALYLLALQNEMQHCHLDMEGISEYINALKDAQKQSKWAGNFITDAILLLISTNTILSTDCFARAEKSERTSARKRKIGKLGTICTRQMTRRPRSRSRPL